MFNFNTTDIVTSLAGISGIGNIISFINNVKKIGQQVRSIVDQIESYKYQLQQYKYNIEQYFNEIKTDIEKAKEIKTEVLAKFEQVENEFDKILAKLKQKHKITK